MIDEGADLPKPVIRGIFSWSKVVIVHKVQVSGDVPEALSGYFVSDGSIACVLVSTPIVVNSWKVHDPHEDIETQEGSELLQGDWRPLLVRFFTHDLFGIPVAFFNYMCLQVSIKEELKHIAWCAWYVDSWTWVLFKWMNSNFPQLTSPERWV